MLQGVNRLALTDAVYLAVGAWPKNMRDVRKLCRRLGLGLMVVVKERVDIVLDPAPHKPRKDKRRLGRLLGEHARRVGDPNRGGSSTKVPMMTAYRQEALRCAGPAGEERADEGGGAQARGRGAQGGGDPAADHYGWFERVERGIYGADAEGPRGAQQHGWKDPS